MMEYSTADALAPLAVWLNNQFLRPITKDLNTSILTVVIIINHLITLDMGEY
jgi:hypothetical protein